MQTLGMGVHCAPAKAWCFLHSKGKASAYSVGGKKSPSDANGSEILRSEPALCAGSFQWILRVQSFCLAESTTKKQANLRVSSLVPVVTATAQGTCFPTLLTPHLITLQRNLHPFQRQFVHSFLLPP